ncbi:Ribonuclease H protein [Dioscorea alata]|uniref:Ribonuclease H protein n=1 Tax=Dioscorea alata TaxID=55571 RepID=A0ACB7VIU3_DIOAL|nr:Ribonuclease H protein [Dioscorea alata]
MLDKLEGLKQIQSFLGKLNYTRKFIPNLSKLAGPLYNKTEQNGERKFNTEDIKLVQKLKQIVSNIKLLELPPPNSYLIIEIDGHIRGWGAVLKFRSSKESLKNEEKISKYDTGTYTTKVTSTDAEILACIKAMEKFKLFVIESKEFLLRTIVKQ